MNQGKVNIAIVGLGFGAEFIPIYQRHPNANMYAICQRNEKKLHSIGDAFGIEKRYTDIKQVLADPQVDAVHINTPIPDHALQSIKALKAGKHVACTVPMATSIEDCRKIVELLPSDPADAARSAQPQRLAVVGDIGDVVAQQTVFLNEVGKLAIAIYRETTAERADPEAAIQPRI